MRIVSVVFLLVAALACTGCTVDEWGVALRLDAEDVAATPRFAASQDSTQTALATSALVAGVAKSVKAPVAVRRKVKPKAKSTAVAAASEADRIAALQKAIRERIAAFEPPTFGAYDPNQ